MLNTHAWAIFTLTPSGNARKQYRCRLA